MSRATRRAKQRELERRILEGEGEGTPIGVVPGPCASCKGERRVWVRLPSKPLDVIPTPCPVCRPEASHLTADFKVKTPEALKAAEAARAKGL